MLKLQSIFVLGKILIENVFFINIPGNQPQIQLQSTITMRRTPQQKQIEFLFFPISIRKSYRKLH